MAGLPPERQRTVYARLLAWQLPERDRLSGRASDRGVDVSDHVVAAPQPERVSRSHHLARDRRGQVVRFRYRART